MKKKKILINIAIIALLIIGLLVMAYPFITQYIYRMEASDQVENFIKQKDDLEDSEVKRKIELAHIFNAGLSGIVTKDPFSQEDREEAINQYARMLEFHEMIGTIEIPKITEKLPVYAGTAEEVLQKGAGHLEGTSLPVGGKTTHCVITAHRGLPNARLFTDLDKLDIGDIFYYTNIKDTMAYKVVDIIVIEPSQFEAIDLEEGKDIMTLLTCTPYMVNSHRLLVKGERIPYGPTVLKEIQINEYNYYYKKLVTYLGVLILLLVIYLIYRYYKYWMLKQEIRRMKERDDA